MNVAELSSAASRDSVGAEVRAPHAPPWLGGFRDLSREHGFEPLEIEGALPGDLVGTLVRNGPVKFGVGGEPYGHWFDGDGGLTAVRFDGARALGATRVTQTAGLLRERAAGKRLFGGYDTPMARPFRELFMNDGKNAANTAVLLWQDRLFATCEAGKPFEVDARDLASIGEDDLGVIDGAFSAHAHYVPSRRTTYNFGLKQGRNTKVACYALPDHGAAQKIASFTIEGARLNHDFVVTDRHLVFTFAPMHLSLLALLMKKAPVSSAKWRPADGTEIVVVPIDDPTRILRFRTDAFLLEHTVNAWEENGDVVFDYTHYASPDGLESFARGLVRGVLEGPASATIRRGRVDPRRGTFASELLFGRAVELPRVAPRVEASRHRFAYYAEVGSDTPFAAVLKHDVRTGQVDRYAPGALEYPGEAVFVPKGGDAEDDGYVLTLVYDARRDRTRLDVLDARRFADGPIAKCWFDHAVPFGFHGAWSQAG